MPEPQGETDELFDVRTQFYIGNYQSAINEAQKLKLSNPLYKLERDVFVFRGFIALKKYGVVLNEINGSSPSEVLPLRQLAEYFSQPTKREAIVLKLDQQVSGSFDVNNYVFLLVAATIYYHENSFETVLKVLHQSDHLECRALALQTQLKMDRLDLARKELKKMQDIDDDAVLTQLASAWVNLAIGGEKLQEAYYTFQELADKNAPTALLLNGQATCCINQGKYEEAESTLQEALEKDTNNTDTLMNLVVLSQLSSKLPEVSSRYFGQLVDSAPDHPLVKEFQTKDKDFDRLALQYGPTLSV
uniref:Coatomer subunit epsilon n=1 Tax=Scapholeberis mucronata TaxID=202097 RepID=A0A4Y7NKI6_9CRUS|nr:EOG090X0A8E [Scapholeberis mucronata]SVE93768.1 EOG090X0A8E [Scapholeberis mucronata]